MVFAIGAGCLRGSLLDHGRRLAAAHFVLVVGSPPLPVFVKLRSEVVQDLGLPGHLSVMEGSLVGGVLNADITAIFNEELAHFEVALFCGVE